MSQMTMPPDFASGLPTPPGGGDPTMGGNAPPRDALNAGPVPSDGGMAGLLAALGGGGGDGGPPSPDAGGGPPTDGTDGGQMDALGHIQAAMQHLMMAMTMEPDESHGLGITKGMGALQAILAGKQKSAQDQSAASVVGGGPPGGGGGPSGG